MYMRPINTKNFRSTFRIIAAPSAAENVSKNLDFAFPSSCMFVLSARATVALASFLTFAASSAALWLAPMSGRDADDEAMLKCYIGKYMCLWNYQGRAGSI